MANCDPTVERAMSGLTAQDTKDITIFAVMGTTGSGKSTFIQKATGNQNVVVGHRLQACTQEPWLYEFSFQGRQLALLDTPGFDDTYKTDAEVLQGVATFLAGTYKHNMRLSGIIYLQRITDPRMTHGGRANLELFRALCGDDPLRKVILATTFWGEMNNKQRAMEHEEELRTNPDYWGDMLSKKASMTQFQDTKESALEIVQGLLKDEEKITLKIQREMVDQNLDLVETTAGETLKRELKEMAERYERQVQQLKQEWEAALKARDFELQEVKELQAKKSERTRQIFQNQMDLLKAKTREDLMARDMEFDARLRIMAKEQEIETGKVPETETPQTLILTTTKKKNDEQVPTPAPTPSPSPNGKKDLTEEEKANAKILKREKYLTIFGAIGTTATAAGLSVINPLAIPVAFGGLIGIINACFSRKEPQALSSKPEVYSALGI